MGQETLFRERLRLYDRTMDSILNEQDQPQRNEEPLMLMKRQESDLKRVILTFQNFIMGSSVDSFEQ